MAVKSVRDKGLPDMIEILRAIQSKVGDVDDKTSQNELLRGMLGPKYTAGLTADDINQMVTKIRQLLSKCVTVHAIRRSVPGSGESEKYYLRDIFQKGPEVIMKREYLDKIGWDVEGNKSKESDETDATSIQVEYRTPASRRKQREGSQEEWRPSPRPEDATDSQPPRSAASETSVGEKQKSSGTVTQKQGSSKENTGTASDTPTSKTSLRRKSSDADIEMPLEKRPVKVPERAITLPTSNVITTADTPPRRAAPTRVAEGADASHRDTWAREAGLRDVPEVPPTMKPTNPAEIINAGDAAWTAQQMGTVQTALENAMLSYFQAHRISPEANSNLVPEPAQELGELYTTLFDRADWGTRAVKLAGLGFAMSQDYTVMSLFGAAIYQKVFQATGSWDLVEEIPRLLGPTTMKYVDQVMSDYGHETKTFLRYVAGKQIADGSFKEVKVAQHAAKLAQATAITMLPHLQRLSKSKKAAGTSKYKPWIEYLEEAFRKAIITKQTLATSNFGPFNFVWTKFTIPLNHDQHQPVFELPGATHIIHTVVPGIVTATPGGQTWFYKSAVVPIKHSERR